MSEVCSQNVQKLLITVLFWQIGIPLYVFIPSVYAPLMVRFKVQTYYFLNHIVRKKDTFNHDIVLAKSLDAILF